MVTLESKVEDSIRKAHSLYSKYSPSLMEDARFRELLHRYEESIQNTQKLLNSLGISNQCAECGKRPTGSCCAPEVATWYDPETLFINLLMNCRLQTKGAYVGHCCFLGQYGCTLKGRHYFCVNFLCDSIKARLSEEEIRKFCKVAGREINLASDVMSYFFLWRKKEDGVIVA